MTRERVEREKRREERERELDLLLDNDVEYYYICKRGLFYRPDSCGYTDFQWRAGVYKKKFAVGHAKGCEEIHIRPVNIEDHNSRVEKQIQELTENLISVPL